jgi:riboflavin synthase
MFTGIVQQIGTIQNSTLTGDNLQLNIYFQQPLGLTIGDSIAVNGTCLTITAITDTTFNVTAVAETLRLTNLSSLIEGDNVNLETPLTANRSMGGHYVQGHIDGTAQISELIKTSDSWQVSFLLTENLARYIVIKGFITIDGMSITVTEVQTALPNNMAQFSVVFIPHTITNTIVQFYQPGQFVNIETDIMAKYVERYIHAQQHH